MQKIQCAMLVDSDPISTFLSKEFVSRISDTVITAQNDEDALRLLKKHLDSNNPFPELLIVDPNTQSKDAFAFVEELGALNKNNSSNKSIVVLLAAAIHPTWAKKLEGSSIKAIVEKPLTPKKISDLYKNSVLA